MYSVTMNAGEKERFINDEVFAKSVWNFGRKKTPASNQMENNKSELVNRALGLRNVDRRPQKGAPEDKS
ncbi:unnamed protein product [Leptosia nina]|uniref:Uncharacterized protein n=1 Tax=Leptosia nina TaxID=320188 RepID=A0AAV1JWY2_9NEOP